MPVLTNLTARLASDSDWQDVYGRNLSQAQDAAQRIFLVHVSGHFIPFENLFDTPPYCIPRSSESVGYCSQVSRDSEDAHGLPRCVYFYAGRACPDFGPIALAFPPAVEAGQIGSATPYDTGGLFKGYIKWNLPDYLPATLANFTKESIFDLGEWRQAFGTYLAAYFNPLQAYWFAQPWKDDPDGLFQPANHWRAWVFEIRLDTGPSILSAAAWCARPDQADLLYDAAEREPPIGSSPSPLQEFVDSVLEIVPGGTNSYCEELEVWVRAAINL